MHCAALDVLLYCPAGQGSQPVPLALIAVPAAHVTLETQAVIPVCIVVVPGRHGVQPVLLYPEAKVPAGHSTNPELPLALLNVPGVVMAQALAPVEPVFGLYEPGLQLTQALALDAPGVGL